MTGPRSPYQRRKGATITDRVEEKLIHNPFTYTWIGFPMGVRKTAPSAFDAVIEVVRLQLGDRVSHTEVLNACGTSAASLSRHRYDGASVSHRWLLRAAVFSGIPYWQLCEVAQVEPVVEPFVPVFNRQTNLKEGQQ